MLSSRTNDISISGLCLTLQMVSDLDEQQNTPLHLAVENRSYDVAKLCLEKGADVNKTTDNYSTPLHLAAVTGDIKIVQVTFASVIFIALFLATPMYLSLCFYNGWPKHVACTVCRVLVVSCVIYDNCVDFSCCCLTMPVLTLWISTNQHRCTEQRLTTTATWSNICSAS